MTDPQGFDHAAFRRFEHDGWTEVASDYHNSFGELTEQTVARLLDAAGVAADQSVLDLACGSGRHAVRALERGATVTGLDLTQAMVDEAKARCPGAAFQVGDAEDLPFEDHTFDAVVCGFGVLHFPDAPRAVREVLRVLRPGARFACSIWRPADASPFVALVRDAVAAHGAAKVDLPAGPEPYQYGEPERLTRLLSEAGLSEVGWQEAPVMIRLDEPEQVFDTLLEGGVRARKLLMAQSPADYEQIRAHATAAAARFRTDSGIEIPRPAIIGFGTRA